MKQYRPIDLAKQLKISTSLVRQYEERGLIPKAERSENDYRLYTEEHLYYLTCVRRLQAGFSSTDIKHLIELMMHKEYKQAFIISNEKQWRLFEKIQYAKKTFEAFQDQETFIRVLSIKGSMNIKEASTLTGVVDTTLRHWESESLLEPKRNKENGYRLYNKEDILKILIIKTIKSATWSLVEAKEFLKDFHSMDFNSIRNLAEQSLTYLYDLNIYQHQGVAALYQLAKDLGYIEDEYRPDYTFNITL